MSTVDSRSGFSPVLKSMTILACAIALSFGFSRALDVIPWSGLYQNKFSFIPGHWFRSQLTLASAAPGDTCILVGASVVREGFDSDQLSLAVPGVKFVNLATTGGFSPMDVLDIQSRILAQAGGRYRCIIVGMNNFYMRHFDRKAYELVTTDYLSQIPIRLLGEPRVWEGGSNKRLIINRLVVPFARNSVIAQRWWRYSLYSLRRLVSRDGISISSYEVEPNEFKPAVQFQYLGRPSIFDKNVERAKSQFVEHQLDQPASYTDPRPLTVFRQTIDRLSKLTGHIIIVTMPLSSVYHDVERISEPAFDAARASVKNVMFLRCEMDTADERSVFYDTSHPNAEGRKLLSNSLSSYLRPALNGDATVLRGQGCRPLPQ